MPKKKTKNQKLADKVGAIPPEAIETVEHDVFNEPLHPEIEKVVDASEILPNQGIHIPPPSPFDRLSEFGLLDSVKYCLCPTCAEGYINDTECRHCVSFIPKCPKCGQQMSHFLSETALKERIKDILDYRSKGI